MKQLIQHTDAFILMEFGRAVAHLKGKPLAEIRPELMRLAKPYAERLKANGHDRSTGPKLLAAAFEVQEPATQGD